MELDTVATETISKVVEELEKTSERYKTGEQVNDKQSAFCSESLDTNCKIWHPYTQLALSKTVQSVGL